LVIRSSAVATVTPNLLKVVRLLAVRPPASNVIHWSTP
jgi:hypothetical protein